MPPAPFLFLPLGKRVYQTGPFLTVEKTCIRGAPLPWCSKQRPWASTVPQDNHGTRSPFLLGGEVIRSRQPAAWLCLSAAALHFLAQIWRKYLRQEVNLRQDELIRKMPKFVAISHFFALSVTSKYG